MTATGASDLLADPFHEFACREAHRDLQLLGARFRFESNSRRLLRLVDSAYARLPGHRFSDAAPLLRVTILLASTEHPGRRQRPAPLAMMGGPGMIGGATSSSNVVVVSPRERSALVSVSPQMLRSAYHTRYEMIEFAVFTLAARTQGLVPLHAACVSRRGRGLLLMGPSGAGKSTLALQCLLQGLEFVAEDGVFVAPWTMRATGIANFLHVRSDSLGWIESVRDAAAIRRSPTIRRRSGIKKFEVDLRRPEYRLAPQPPTIRAIVFLSARSAGRGPLLRPMPRSKALRHMTAAQAYAANQPPWASFVRGTARMDAFELRRGRHPREAVDALRTLIDP